MPHHPPSTPNRSVARASRSSRQREAIACYLSSVDLHPTAEEVLHAVRLALPSLGLATVYRNLETLVREGRASRTMHPDGARYDSRVDPHHHFICTQCGKVQNVEPCPEQTSWTEAFQRKTGASVDRLVMELRGVCAACRQG